MLDANAMLWHFERALDFADEETGIIVGITEIEEHGPGTALITYYDGNKSRREFRLTLEEVKPDPRDVLIALVADLRNTLDDPTQAWDIALADFQNEIKSLG